ncbi:MAG: hypothetical protein A2822_00365 [Candidatus Staskawiczbacteria bacterium RIFCSPHIGHO2_01_FULL_41_41]|uniref:Uncharacterized protein n=1 Tax=Candidatus Staskawiczbacteria bacterium RIFCSPHIGHO2_01_FULL_41_41 TaxID=1802203 RepID=A0A1G2HRW2_9BACT|nr:MAG: hypothetical protein A2822_00365 [Candidatus Staskawiczbacteria bacterium RIFCSPHIGHO2_01_FULL_41_41]OGZ74845.1 MAG: hypothetical protein A3A12_03265 [Candidatus Staskawiczbacteria bacterium RIFCSPLOWO2_01_FULL_43_17b]
MGREPDDLHLEIRKWLSERWWARLLLSVILAASLVALFIWWNEQRVATLNEKRQQELRRDK